MATIVEIPLSAAAPQTFNIGLAGVEYRLTLIWQQAAQGGWVLDIAEAGGAPILAGLPLVTGVDLLAQHRHLGIGGQLRVISDTSPDAVPGFADLGVTGRLYFMDSP